MTKPSQKKQAPERTADAVPVAAQPASLTERVARVQAEAAKAGFISDGSDGKALMDEMWGEAY